MHDTLPLLAATNFPPLRRRRLDTLQAAVLLVKLGIFDEEMALRQQVAERYTQLLNEAGLI